MIERPPRPHLLASLAAIGGGCLLLAGSVLLYEYAAWRVPWLPFGFVLLASGPARLTPALLGVVLFCLFRCAQLVPGRASLFLFTAVLVCSVATGIVNLAAVGL